MSRAKRYLIRFKGPDPFSGDEPAKIFAADTPADVRKDLIFKAYENLKDAFAKLKKPDGTQKSPAKTCRELKATYPETASGTLLFPNVKKDRKEGSV
jgi:hypothetical protein